MTLTLRMKIHLCCRRPFYGIAIIAILSFLVMFTLTTFHVTNAPSAVGIYKAKSSMAMDTNSIHIAFYSSLRSAGLQFNKSNKYISKEYSGIYSPSNVTVKRKLILEWTSFFSISYYSAPSECPVNACDVTTNRAELSRSDAVLFHFRDMNINDFPHSRKPHQRFVLFSAESPLNLALDLSVYNGLFNWTTSYRHDSDLVVPYGSITRRPQDLTETELRLHVDQILVNKRRLVAARISNCESSNNRIRYIEELGKYIQVDFYGLCGSIECSGAYCDNELPKEYKFYLAFENSNCKDYITEKFWKPLAIWNSVPVVMGGSSIEDYTSVVPPMSFIHVDNFYGPKQLAAYLRYLDENTDHYRELFRWHGRFIAENGLEFCSLCQSLHNPSLPYQSYSNLNDWFDEKTCPLKMIPS